MRLLSRNSVLVSFGLSFLASGISLTIQCNGFVAVFCQTVSIRNFTRRHEYSQWLNHAAEQFERLGMVGVLVLLGTSIAQGQLRSVGAPELAYAALMLLAVRPMSVLLGCLGSRTDAGPAQHLDTSESAV